MRHKLFDLKHTFLSIIFLISFLALNAQKNPSSQQDYYATFWLQNIDSLSKSWIIQKQNLSAMQKAAAENGIIRTINDIKVEDYISQLDSSIKFRYSPRVGDLLSVYFQDKTKLAIAMSYADFLSIEFEKALQQNGLPSVLKNLPLALSAMNDKAIGKTGMGGLWQIMYANGRRQKLRIDSYVDERRDIHLACQAASKELKTFFDLYQNWGLALAAYTCGPTNVNKAIRRNNNQMDFYTIYNSLPDYGRDVVPALTAVSILTQFPSDFGIHKIQMDFAIAVDTIEVSKRLHFQQIQDIMHISIEELRYLNPKYKFDIVPAIDEVFYINLPAGKMAEFNELEDSIYHYKDTVLFNLKKPVVLPPAAKGRHYARYEPELPPDNSTLVHYTIKSGDNLGYIASWYGVKVRQIEDWNNIYDPRRLKLGRKLKIYVPEKKAAFYSGVDKMSFEQKQKRVGKTVSSGSVASHTPKKEEPLGKDFFWYKVKSGESPYTIAKKYKGVSADDILRWNNISDPRNIKVGQKLKIKKVK